MNIKKISEIKNYLVFRPNYVIYTKKQVMDFNKDKKGDILIKYINNSFIATFDTLAEAQAFVRPLLKVKQTIVEGKSGAFALNVVGLSNLITAAFLEATHKKIITETEYVELFAKYSIESQTMNMGKMINGKEIKQFSTTVSTQLEYMFEKLIDKDDLFHTDKQIMITIKETCEEFENIDKTADTPKELVRIIGKAFSGASNIKSQAQMSRLDEK